MKNPQEAFRSEMYVAVKTSGVPTQRRNTTYKNSPYTLIVHSPTKRYRIYSCQIYQVNVYPFPISRKLLYFHYYEILTSKSISFVLNSKVSASSFSIVRCPIPKAFPSLQQPEGRLRNFNTMFLIPHSILSKDTLSSLLILKQDFFHCFLSFHYYYFVFLKMKFSKDFFLHDRNQMFEQQHQIRSNDVNLLYPIKTENIPKNRCRVCYVRL